MVVHPSLTHPLATTAQSRGANETEPLGAPMPLPAVHRSSPDAPAAAVRTAAPAAAVRTATLEADDADDPDTAGFARHVFGFLLGLLLTPVGVVLVGLGLARLDATAATSALEADALTLGLLAGGVGVLVCLALLGVWTPALPITGGAVWGVAAGVAAAAWPGFTTDLLDSLVDDGTAATNHLARTVTSGDLVVVGVLLLAAGVAAGVGRRQGRRRAERTTAVRRRGRPPVGAGNPAHART